MPSRIGFILSIALLSVLVVTYPSFVHAGKTIVMEDCDARHQVRPTDLLRCFSIRELGNQQLECRFLLCNRREAALYPLLHFHINRMGSPNDYIKLDILSPLQLDSPRELPTKRQVFGQSLYCLERSAQVKSPWPDGDPRSYDVTLYDRRGMPKRTPKQNATPGKVYHTLADSEQDHQILTTFCYPDKPLYGRPPVQSYCHRAGFEAAAYTELTAPPSSSSLS